MQSQQLYYCSQCDLKFNSAKALERHKIKFCVEKISKDVFQNTFHIPRQEKDGNSSTNNIEELKKQTKVLEKERQNVFEQLSLLSGIMNTRNESSLSYVEKINDFKDQINNQRHQRVSISSVKQRNGDHLQYEKLLKDLRIMRDDYVRSDGCDENVMSYFEKLDHDLMKLLNRNKKDGAMGRSGYADGRLGHMDGRPGYTEGRPGYSYGRPGYTDGRPGYTDDRPGYTDVHNQIHVLQSANEELRREVENMRLHHNYVGNDRSYLHQQPAMTRGPAALSGNHSNMLGHSLHEQRLLDMRHEAEIYRQQLEVERLRQELISLRGHPSKPILPQIGYQQNTADNQTISVTKQQDVNKPVMSNDLNASPYDPEHGFAVFWDFISSLDHHHDFIQLSVNLHNNGLTCSETKCLPIVQYTSKQDETVNRIAMLGVKQVFARCYPQLSLSLVFHLKSSSSTPNNNNVTVTNDHASFKQTSWSKVKLFDQHNQLLSGRWKVPLRALPIRKNILPSELNSIPQVDGCELYYRLVNYRDVTSQEKLVLDEHMMSYYNYPHITMEASLEVPAQTIPIEKQRKTPVVLTATSHHTIKPTQYKTAETSKLTLVETPNETRKNAKQVQVKNHKAHKRRVIISPESLNSDALSLRSMSDEQLQNIATSSTLVTQSRLKQPAATKIPSPVKEDRQPSKEKKEKTKEISNSTTTLKQLSLETNIGIQIDRIVDLKTSLLVKVVLTVYGCKEKVAICNHGDAVFSTTFVQPTFLRDVHNFALQQVYYPSIQLFHDSFLLIEIFEQSDNVDSQDTLVAWSVTSLFTKEHSDEEQHNNDEVMEVKEGVLHLPLYQAPSLSIKKIVQSLKSNDLSNHVVQHENEAVITLFMYNDNLRALGLPLILPDTKLRTDIPEGYWIEHKREVPTEVFENGQAFDVYIDAGKCFPQSTLAVKVFVGFYDGKTFSKKSPFKRMDETRLNLDMSTSQPVFDARFEYRDFTFYPQSKLVFKVFILDAVTKQVSLYGQTILPLFLMKDSLTPADNSSTIFCLNVDCLQLKLYEKLMDEVYFDPNQLQRPLLCTSLLVRIVPAVCYKDGQPKQASEFPQDEWLAEGLLVPPPLYQEGYYDSTSCIPTISEIEHFHAFQTMDALTTRDHLIKTAVEIKKVKTDDRLLDYLKTKFKVLDAISKNDMKPLDNMARFPSNMFAKYDSNHGIFFNVTHAQNIPWNGFTFATCCMSPPAFFYEGSIEDPATLILNINPDSPQKHPQWLEKLKVFPRRKFHTNLSLIVHLYEVVPTAVDFSISQEAWTLIPVCQSGYLLHGIYQVPLFNGAPSESVLRDIQSRPLLQTVTTLRKKKVLKLVDGASVFITIGDPRRINEAHNEQLERHLTFLPQTNKYLQAVQSKSLRSAIPPGIPSNDYVINVAAAFKQLITVKFNQRKVPVNVPI